MGHIVIQLRPRELSNPDLDLRYRIPELLESVTAGRVQGDGYDYAAEDVDTLIIYLRCQDAACDVESVIVALQENEVCGNCVLDSAVIGMSDDGRTFAIVHPPSEQAEFSVRPW